MLLSEYRALFSAKRTQEFFTWNKNKKGAPPPKELVSETESWLSAMQDMVIRTHRKGGTFDFEKRSPTRPSPLSTGDVVINRALRLMGVVVNPYSKGPLVTLLLQTRWKRCSPGMVIKAPRSLLTKVSPKDKGIPAPPPRNKRETRKT